MTISRLPLILLALLCLSSWHSPVHRDLACLDADSIDPEPLNLKKFPLQPSFFQPLLAEDEAELQRSAAYFQKLLIGASNDYLSGLRDARGAMGLNAPLFSDFTIGGIVSNPMATSLNFNFLSPDLNGGLGLFSPPAQTPSMMYSFMPMAAAQPVMTRGILPTVGGVRFTLAK